MGLCCSCDAGSGSSPYDGGFRPAPVAASYRRGDSSSARGAPKYGSGRGSSGVAAGSAYESVSASVGGGAYLESPAASGVKGRVDPSRSVSAGELAAHRSRSDGWLAIKGRVYDVTDFMRRHPGGSAPLERALGRDATAEFYAAHPRGVHPSRKLNYIGVLSG